MRNGEPNMYAGLATLRNGHVQGQWSRLQLFLTFNAIAIPIVIATEQSVQIKTLISGAGILIHYTLLLGAVRANEWTKFWDKKMAALERLDGKKKNGTRVRVFSDGAFTLRRVSKFSTRFSFIPLAILAIGFWIVEVVYNAQLLVR